ncbi:MAG: hypothetical protein FWD79_09185, partial [Desulfobulbus sp.]|nr:hypothetical protein [Desulfobulbus sp.]
LQFHILTNHNRLDLLLPIQNQITWPARLLFSFQRSIANQFLFFLVCCAVARKGKNRNIALWK